MLAKSQKMWGIQWPGIEEVKLGVVAGDHTKSQNIPWMAFSYYWLGYAAIPVWEFEEHDILKGWRCEMNRTLGTWCFIMAEVVPKSQKRCRISSSRLSFPKRKDYLRPTQPPFWIIVVHFCIKFPSSSLYPLSATTTHCESRLIQRSHPTRQYYADVLTHSFITRYILYPTYV